MNGRVIKNLGICSGVGQRGEVIFILKQQEKEDILVFLQI